MFCNLRGIDIKNLRMQAPKPHVQRKSLVSGMSPRTNAVEARPKHVAAETAKLDAGWLQGLRTLLGFGQ